MSTSIAAVPTVGYLNADQTLLNVDNSITPGIERVQALADISRSFRVIATKPVHRLQICPIMHN